ncbi:hypothetical protein AO411_2019260 [Salmonella enterica subsp. enterica serovar Sarajane]|nr:hypothetical protein AO411_2019260 [Salmonella enterica subsp. enterica serovar Sarajane]
MYDEVHHYYIKNTPQLHHPDTISPLLQHFYATLINKNDERWQILIWQREALDNEQGEASAGFKGALFGTNDFTRAQPAVNIGHVPLKQI